MFSKWERNVKAEKKKIFNDFKMFRLTCSWYRLDANSYTFMGSILFERIFTLIKLIEHIWRGHSKMTSYTDVKNLFISLRVKKSFFSFKHTIVKILPSYLMLGWQLLPVLTPQVKGYLWKKGNFSSHATILQNFFDFIQPWSIFLFKMKFACMVAAAVTILNRK